MQRESLLGQARGWLQLKGEALPTMSNSTWRLWSGGAWQMQAEVRAYSAGDSHRSFIAEAEGIVEAAVAKASAAASKAAVTNGAAARRNDTSLASSWTRSS